LPPDISSEHSLLGSQASNMSRICKPGKLILNWLGEHRQRKRRTPGDHRIRFDTGANTHSCAVRARDQCFEAGSAAERTDPKWLQSLSFPASSQR
jgi:hypothetical protein